MNGKLGSASTVIYFTNHKDPTHAEGTIILAPYSAFPTPEGWSRHEADDLASVRRLEDRLNDQETRRLEAQYHRSEATLKNLRQKVRDQLMAKLLSSETSEYDRDFIKEWIRLRDEKKRAKYQAAFEHRAIFLHQLHNDIPADRDANDETVNVDRIG